MHSFRDSFFFFFLNAVLEIQILYLLFFVVGTEFLLPSPLYSLSGRSFKKDLAEGEVWLVSFICSVISTAVIVIHVISPCDDKCHNSGVLEANFIEPAHDKQDFERTPLFIRLEARLRQIIIDFW